MWYLVIVLVTIVILTTWRVKSVKLQHQAMICFACAVRSG